MQVVFQGKSLRGQMERSPRGDQESLQAEMQIKPLWRKQEGRSIEDFNTAVQYEEVLQGQWGLFRPELALRGFPGRLLHEFPCCCQSFPRDPVWPPYTCGGKLQRATSAVISPFYVPCSHRSDRWTPWSSFHEEMEEPREFHWVHGDNKRQCISSSLVPKSHIKWLRARKGHVRFQLGNIHSHNR